MLVLNKGKRIIDGIYPNEKKDINNELAINLSSMYKDEIIIFGETKNIDNELKNEIQRLKVENDGLKLELEKLKEDIVNKDTKSFNNFRKK